MDDSDSGGTSGGLSLAAVGLWTDLSVHMHMHMHNAHAHATLPF